jgi:glycosyltransferase involved in cell wall biosynthesis
MSAGHAARVVIGVPVHDSEPFLVPTLTSIAAQDHPNLEIVISDDASSDGTVDLCRRFAREDSRFRVVTHGERRDWIGNYNSLLAHASGEYFVWMPHDDLYEPSYVRELVALLEAQPEAVVAYSMGTLIDDGGRPFGRAASRVPNGTGSRLARGMRYLWWTEREKALPFRGVFRSRALRGTRGLRAVRFAADNLLMFELSLRGAFAYDPRPLFSKRCHPGSVSTTYGHAHWEWLEYFAAHCEVIRDAALPRLETAVLLAAVHARRVRYVLGRPVGALKRAGRAGATRLWRRP